MKFDIRNKKIISFILVAVIMVGVFGVMNAAQADFWDEIGDAVTSILGWILRFFVWIGGGILAVLMYVLIWIAQYNDFINADAVKIGWVLVRDISNMFFILVLIVLAFGTLLRQDEYGMKNLPTVLIMAVLINFSKTICGLALDFAQVIMLTFVNAFKALGAGNLAEMMGITKIMQVNLDSAGAGNFAFLEIIATYVLAFIYIVVAIIVIGIMVAVLVMRIVMLWIYIVLAPLAFLLSAFKAGKKYSGMWVKKFTGELIIGPILAFFIWLSFTSLGAGSTPPLDSTPEPANTPGGFQDRITNSGSSNASSTVSPYVGLSEGGTPQNVAKFIIAIGMLVAGLMIAKELGAAGSDLAGRGAKEVMGGLKTTRKGARRVARATLKPAAMAAVRGGIGLAGKSLSTFGGTKDGKNRLGMASAGNVLQNWSKDMTEKRKDDKAKKWQKRFEKVGMGENTMAAVGSALQESNLPMSRVKGGPVGKIAFAASQFAKRRLKYASAGAEKGSKDIEDARKIQMAAVDNEDYAKNIKVGEFYSNSGQTAKQNKQMRLFNNGSVESAKITKNMEGFIKSGDVKTNVLEDMARGFAAFKKDGGEYSADMEKVAKAIDVQLEDRGKEKIDDRVKKVVSYGGSTDAIATKGSKAVGADDIDGRSASYPLRVEDGGLRLANDKDPHSIGFDFRDYVAKQTGITNNAMKDTQEKYVAKDKNEAIALGKSVVAPHIDRAMQSKEFAGQRRESERLDREEKRIAKDKRMDPVERAAKIMDIQKQREERAPDITRLKNTKKMAENGEITEFYNTAHKNEDLRDKFVAGVNSAPPADGPVGPDGPDGSGASPFGASPFKGLHPDLDDNATPPSAPDISDAVVDTFTSSISNSGLADMGKEMGEHFSTFAAEVGNVTEDMFDQFLDSYARALEAKMNSASSEADKLSLGKKLVQTKLANPQNKAMHEQLKTAGIGEKNADQLMINLSNHGMAEFSEDAAKVSNKMMEGAKSDDPLPSFKVIVEGMHDSMRRDVATAANAPVKERKEAKLNRFEILSQGTRVDKVLSKAPATVYGLKRDTDNYQKAQRLNEVGLQDAEFRDPAADEAAQGLNKIYGPRS